MESYAVPVYQRTWFIVLTLILFAPVGIFLLWRYTKRGYAFKSAISVLSGAFFLMVLISAFTPPQQEKDTNRLLAQSVSQSASVTTTPRPVTTSKKVTATTPVQTTTTAAQTTTQPATVTTTARPVTTTAAPPVTSAPVKVQAPVQEPVQQQPQGNLVWIPTKGGHKYHSNPNCSNMDGPRQVTVDEAVSLGFTPCKKCY